MSILYLFQELKFKSHGLAALAINVNRLANVKSHGSNLWELACEHITMLCLSPHEKAFQTFLSISHSGTDFALLEWMGFTCYTTGV
jgi:hypothetical protein